MTNVIQLAEQFRADLIAQDSAALGAMAQRWLAVEKALAAQITAVAEEMAAIKADGGDVPAWKLFQLRRYQSLLTQTGKEIAKYNQWAAGQIEKQQAEAVALGDEHAKGLLLESVESKRELGAAWDQLPTGAIENITAIAQAGQPLNKLLNKAYPKAAQQITNLLISNTAAGINPRETARAAVRQGLASGLNHILLVARDQQIRNYREMVRTRYDQSDVIYGYMRLAAKNSRTCLACLALDGSVWETGKVMPLHPQDRCSMLPLVEGYPLPDFKKGEEWFEGLDEDVQRRMMGNGRYQAWRDGLFQFRQLAGVGRHPVWGPSLQETPLKLLLKGRGGLNGQAIDPADLLKQHQTRKTPKAGKPTVITIGKGDTTLIHKLLKRIPQEQTDQGLAVSLQVTLNKMLDGQDGFVYFGADGRMVGALSYRGKKGDLSYLSITSDAFIDIDGRLKGIKDLAKLASQSGQGIETYVESQLMGFYGEWGFTVHKSTGWGAQMRLSADDIAGFLKDPDGYGQKKLAALSQKITTALADPNQAITFRSGQAIPGLPFKPVFMGESDFQAMTKASYEPPFPSLPPEKHAAAGMLLFTPDGKLVLVDPANKYGGYETTFPKGTQEEGMSLQATAVKEVYEETGFKAKVLGYLGDYEKSTSLTRFYIGVVEDGAPWMAHYETEAVRIVPLDQVDALLNVGTDKSIFADLVKLKKDVSAFLPDNEEFSTGFLESYLNHLAIKAEKAAKALPTAAPVSAVLPPPAKGIKKANQYVEELVQSGRYTAADILDATKNHFPKSIFTLDNVQSKFKKFGMVEPTPVVPEPPTFTKLPLPPDTPANLTKKALMQHLAQVRGIAQWKLSVMKKPEIVALFDLPEAEALAAIDAAGEAHSAKYKEGKSKKKEVEPEEPDIIPARPETAVPEEQQLRTVTAAPPPDPTRPEPESPAPADPVDLQKWFPIDAHELFMELEGSFASGTPAHKGVQKAAGNVGAGHSGFAYKDTAGTATGVITFHDMDGKIKVSGAAFASLQVNKEAIADVANYALGQGKIVKTYVPKALILEYKKWGFVYAGDGGSNGDYMELSLENAPVLVKIAGKTPKRPPKKTDPPPTSTAPSDIPIGTPGDVSEKTAVKLTKAALMTHLQIQTNLTTAVWKKYTKADLVAFMQMPKSQAVAMAGQGQPPPPKPAPVQPKVKKRPLPEDLPDYKAPDPPGFPADVANMRTIERLGGSTGAKLVEDPATGKQYVLKKGNSAGHLLEEGYADAAYQALSLKVPAFKIYETPDGPVKLAEFKSGLKTLGEALANASTAERKKLVREVRKGFAADALLGNWDVVGMSKDNILVDEDGRVWRVDNGGSLRYRAQGAKKDAEFVGDYPVELWTLRDKKVGPENAQIFGDLGIYEIMEQVREILPKNRELLAALPDELRPLVNGRLAVMEDLLGTSDTLKADRWGEGFSDGLLEQSTYIRRAGLIDRLPQQMTQSGRGSTTVKDENGREFDDLRGHGSHVEAWAEFCRANGGDPNIIGYWMSSQAGSSWSGASKALKYRIALDRGENFDDYYWQGGLNAARQEYEATIKKVGKEKYHKTWAMWQAYVYESLRHMEFSRKNGGVVELVRTEGRGIMDLYGLKNGSKNAAMPRGAAESASIYRAKRILAGGEVTIQRVPLHRVLGYYWMDKPGIPNRQGGFLGDGENEFVFIPEGIPFDYVDSISGSVGVEKYWQ